MQKYYIVLTQIKVGFDSKGKPVIIEAGTAIPIDESEAGPLLSCGAIREADDVDAGLVKLYATAAPRTGEIDGSESTGGAAAGNESGGSESAGDDKTVAKPAGKK